MKTAPIRSFEYKNAFLYDVIREEPGLGPDSYIYRCGIKYRMVLPALIEKGRYLLQSGSQRDPTAPHACFRFCGQTGHDCRSLVEARNYIGHPVLGAGSWRARNRSLLFRGSQLRIFSDTLDNMKLQSSMTLFALAAGPGSVFGRVLEKHYQGKRDARTLQIVGNPLGSRGDAEGAEKSS